MDQKDRTLLYEMRDLLVDKPPGLFNRTGTKGLATQVIDLTDKVDGLDTKLNEVLHRLPPLSPDGK